MSRATIALLVFVLGATACSNGGEDPADNGKADGNGPNAASLAASESQLVITIHVKGGDLGKLEYLRSQLAGFGNCMDAKIDPETSTAYALMKPGVPLEFAVNERTMLEAYVRPPQELLMSSWAYNEGNWFDLIGQ